MTNLSQQLFTLQKVFWQILWRMGDHFCNTQEVSKNIGCWQKSYSSSWRNLRANFFFYCRVWQTSKNKFFGFTRSFETYCAKDKMIFLGSRRPINKFFKKRLASPWKNLWSFFLVSPTMADISNFFQGSTINLATFVQVIGSFLQHPNGFWKHPFLKQKAIFPLQNFFWRIFFVSSRKTDLMTNIQKQFIRLDKLFWRLLWKLYDHFLRCWKRS